MRCALFVLPVVLALTLACGGAAEPEEQAASSETNTNSQPTPETSKLSKEAEKAKRRRENGTYCVNVSVYLREMDRQLYELIADAEAGLEHPVDFQIMEQQAMFAVEAGGRLPAQDQTPKDAKKLGRSVEKYHEKVSEFYGNFDQSNAKKVHRGLENLVGDFIDLRDDVEDFCEPYLN